MRRACVLAAAALATAASAGDSALVAWSTAPGDRSMKGIEGGLLTRAALEGVLGPAAGSVAGAPVAHAFLFVDLPGHKLGPVLSATGSAALAGQVAAAPTSLVAPRSDVLLEGEATAADAWVNIFRQRKCALVAVGNDVTRGAAERALSRQQYAEEIAAATPAGTCTVYLVPLYAAAGLEQEVAFVAASAKAAAAGGPAAFVLATADAAPASESVAVPAQPGAERPGTPRRLASTAGTTIYLASGRITMTPGILTGLLVGLLLLFFAAVGLSCVASVATPDQLMSTTLPAGKEY